MRRIIFSLLVLFSINSYAEDSVPTLEETFSSIDVNKLFDKKNKISPVGLIDIIDKEKKISVCVEDYKKKQSRPHAKITQNDLYDLIHNFDKIASRIYGKKHVENDIAHEQKIEALAKIQCEVYYKMGVLK